jgi:transcription initiation factor TFIIF subunit alpha
LGLGKFEFANSYSVNDPDKLPWQLKDADSQGFEGKVEGSQSSNHVLFVSGMDGFKVIPVSKWYRFAPKNTYRTLTLDEAEKKMKEEKNRNDLWVMRAEASLEGKEEVVKKEKKGPPMKAWRQKLMGIDPDATSGNIGPSARKPTTKSSKEDAGMDFEGGFSDDEEINFGMDDEEETKEAQKRMFEKGGEDAELDFLLDETTKVAIAMHLILGYCKKFGET